METAFRYEDHEGDWLEVTAQGLINIGWSGEGIKVSSMEASDVWVRQLPAHYDEVGIDGAWVDVSRGEGEHLRQRIQNALAAQNGVTKVASVGEGPKYDKGKFPAYTAINSIEISVVDTAFQLARRLQSSNATTVLRTAYNLYLDKELFSFGFAQCLYFGAQKYEWDSWKTVPNGEQRYKEAAMRHLLYFFFYPEDTDGLDKESGLHHWIHFITNMRFVEWFESQREEAHDGE